MSGIVRANKQTVQRTGNDAVYGSGVDGNGYINATTTITSDMYYNNLEITSSGILLTNGYKVFVKDTLTLNGYIGMGSVSSGVVGEPASEISDGTVAGNTTSAITYRLGGQGGGGSNPGITSLPAFLYKNIDAMTGGVFADPTNGFIKIGGGSKGSTGTVGVTTPALTASDSWPGKAGAVGTDGPAGSPNRLLVGQPGGKGGTASSGNADGTPGPGGAGGIGGAGGGVVAIFAKRIVGSGKIISIGRSGGSGSPGTSGSAGTKGGNGTKAPDLAYHVAPTSHTNAPARNHNHHNHFTNHSDRHGHVTREHKHAQEHVHHTVQQHVRQHSQEHVNPHHHASNGKGHHYHVNGGHHTTPHHHAGPGHHHHGTPHHHHTGHTTPHHYSHGTPHHHHNGHYHHPHNDSPHGGVYHWGTIGGNDPGWWWHAYWQSSFHHGFPHNTQKPNGHHSSYQPDGNSYWRGQWWHGSFGGHDGHAHAHFGLPNHDHTHKPAHHHAGGGSHDAHQAANHSGGTSQRHAPNWHHHPVAPTSHPNPDGHWIGGAGGVNDGINTGKGAPAVTGGTGKRGGAGGGGAIIVISDSVANTITYDTRAGLTADSDNFSASNGAAYVLLNV